MILASRAPRRKSLYRMGGAKEVSLSSIQRDGVKERSGVALLVEGVDVAVGAAHVQEPPIEEKPT